MEARNIFISLVILGVVCAIEGHKHRGGPRGRPDLGGRKLQLTPEQKQIVNNATAIINQLSTETFIQFFTSISTPEAQKSLKQLNVAPAVIEDILRKLKGDAQQVTEVKQLIKDKLTAVQLDKLGKKEWNAIKQLFMIYQTYVSRQQAKKAIKEDSLENLIKGLTALATIERYQRFRGILFSDLVATLKSKGESGRAEVVDILSKWIDSTEPQSINKATIFYMMATRMQTTPPSMSSYIPTTTSGWHCNTSPTGQPRGQATSPLSTPQPSGQATSPLSTPPPSGQATSPLSTPPPSGQATSTVSGQSTSFSPSPLSTTTSASSAASTTTARRAPE